MTDEVDDSAALSGVVTLIIKAGLASLYLGALVFLAGWSYADRYFAELGLNLAAIDGLDTSTYSGFALWVFRDGVLTIFAFAAAIGVGLFLANRSLGMRGSPVLLLVASVLALLMLVGAAQIGAVRAGQQVPDLFEKNYQNFVRIRVVAREDSPLNDVFVARGNLGNSTCLRKVFMDRRNLYAYAGYMSTKAPRQPIMIMPLSEVALIETVSNQALCTP
ncbi:MAG: hypothetical protein ABJH07_00345 [Sedimentitalea sp.]|uniref:hypothetical protein n=1 Tax=Sedimentitalea sp. TaxID=2048915 RepID=UPI0032639CF3